MDEGFGYQDCDDTWSLGLVETSRPFSDFNSASRSIIEYLQKLTNFGLCGITRAESNGVLFLTVSDRDYGVSAGDTVEWNRTICSRVVEEAAPRFINDTSAAGPSIASLILSSPLKVGAYVGIPLILADNTVFGTVCAINPAPAEPLTPFQITTLCMMAKMLSTILSLELQTLDQRRSYERAKMESEQDELSGLLNRRGWDRAIMEEESLCAQYGLSASIVVIDLDDLKLVNDTQGHKAGDEMIRKAAKVIEQTSRSGDVVARTGGDEFAVLTKNMSGDSLAALARRVRIALMVAGVSASVGTSTRTALKSLIDAWQEADAAMYVSKRSKG